MKCLVCGEEMINTIGGCYHCPKCGEGVNDLVYRRNIGTLSGTTLQTHDINIRQGWQCPKCGSILSPDKDHCPFCSGGSSYTINGQTYDVVRPNIG